MQRRMSHSPFVPNESRAGCDEHAPAVIRYVQESCCILDDQANDND